MEMQESYFHVVNRILLLFLGKLPATVAAEAVIPVYRKNASIKKNLLLIYYRP